MSGLGAMEGRANGHIPTNQCKCGSRSGKACGQEGSAGELRSQGVKPTQVKPAEIGAMAQAYLSQHPELWRTALERAQHMAQEDELRKRKPRRSV